MQDQNTEIREDFTTDALHKRAPQMVYPQRIRSTGDTNLLGSASVQCPITAEIQRKNGNQYFYLTLRIGTYYPDQRVALSTLSEISTDLSLDEANKLRERIVDFVMARTRDEPFSLTFACKNPSSKEKLDGFPFAYVHRRQFGSEVTPVTLTLAEERGSETGHLRIELRAKKADSDTWSANVLFSREQALLFAYMIYFSQRRCMDYRDTLKAWKQGRRAAKEREPELQEGQMQTPSIVSEESEPDPERTVLEEAMEYTEQIFDLVRQHYDPRPSANDSELKSELTMQMIQIVQRYRPGPFEKW
jgi:hypothetical protein